MRVASVAERQMGFAGRYCNTVLEGFVGRSSCFAETEVNRHSPFFCVSRTSIKFDIGAPTQIDLDIDGIGCPTHLGSVHMATRSEVSRDVRM